VTNANSIDCYQLFFRVVSRLEAFLAVSNRLRISRSSESFGLDDSHIQFSCQMQRTVGADLNLDYREFLASQPEKQLPTDFFQLCLSNFMQF
jgi:hypothetical protein